MAKGWSGSPKHTATYGDGSGMSSSANQGEMGPRIGPGAMQKRVTAEYAKQGKGGDGAPKTKGMKTYQGE